MMFNAFADDIMPILHMIYDNDYINTDFIDSIDNNNIDDINALTLFYMLFTSVLSNDAKEHILVGGKLTQWIILGLGYEIYTNQGFNIINEHLDLDILTMIVYSFVSRYDTILEGLNVSSIFSYIIPINLDGDENALKSYQIYLNNFTPISFSVIEQLQITEINDVLEPIVHLTEVFVKRKNTTY